MCNALLLWYLLENSICQAVGKRYRKSYLVVNGAAEMKNNKKKERKTKTKNTTPQPNNQKISTNKQKTKQEPQSRLLYLFQAEDTWLPSFFFPHGEVFLYFLLSYCFFFWYLFCSNASPSVTSSVHVIQTADPPRVCTTINTMIVMFYISNFSIIFL